MLSVDHARESEARPGWVRSGQRDWRKGKPGGEIFELAADHDVAVWTKRVRPQLTIRCLSGNSDVFVTTHSAASFEHDAGTHTVRIVLDDNAPAEERWEDSADHDALFAPDGASLARQLTKSRKMSFGFTPFNASPVVIDFAVTGLDAQMASAAKACGWK